MSAQRTDGGPRHRAAGPAHPWRRTARTVFQAGAGLCAAAPGIYVAATQQDPLLATGAVGTGLTVAAAVTRVMAFPGFEQWLQRFVPWLAADDVDAAEVDQANDVVRHLRATTVPAAEVAVRVADEPGVQLVAGPASVLPDGTPVATAIAIATNAAFGLYLVLVAPATLATSPVWSGALDLLGLFVETTPAVLAAPLWLSAALMAAGLLARTHVLLLVGCVVGFGAWGLLAGSWGYAAATLSGLGAGSVVMAVCCVIPTHAAVLMPREERRDTAQEA